jgi:hypothetical protein
MGFHIVTLENTQGTSKKISFFMEGIEIQGCDLEPKTKIRQLELELKTHQFEPKMKKIQLVSKFQP